MFHKELVTNELTIMFSSLIPLLLAISSGYHFLMKNSLLVKRDKKMHKLCLQSSIGYLHSTVTPCGI